MSSQAEDKPHFYFGLRWMLLRMEVHLGEKDFAFSVTGNVYSEMTTAGNEILMVSETVSKWTGEVWLGTKTAGQKPNWGIKNFEVRGTIKIH